MACQLLKGSSGDADQQFGEEQTSVLEYWRPETSTLTLSDAFVQSKAPSCRVTGRRSFRPVDGWRTTTVFHRTYGASDIMMEMPLSPGLTLF